MKKIAFLLIFPLLLAGFFTLAMDVSDAEAARFGGGRSFGGSSSFQRSVTMPNRTQAQGVQAARNPNPAPGMAGMRGGFLGPLLAGSMIGALLFGGGFHGFGMADIFIVLLGVFFLSRVLRSRRQAVAEAGAGRHAGPSEHTDAYSGEWDRLRGGGAASAASPSADIRLPEGFDVSDFLHGAKVLFNRMQKAWDSRDLEDIARFATPAVLAQVREQAAADPGPSTTDVLLVEASLAGFEQRGQEEMASVLFEATLRETAVQGTHDVRELWHFVRGDAREMWRLDGLQQVE